MYSEVDNSHAIAPHSKPATRHDSSADGGSTAVFSGNSGPLSSSTGRRKPAITQAIATGARLRGRSSNSSSSTASSNAATGVPNTAVMPATAPATSKVLRSPALR